MSWAQGVGVSNPPAPTNRIKYITVVDYLFNRRSDQKTRLGLQSSDSAVDSAWSISTAVSEHSSRSLSSS